jgi:hypothetical protein
MTSKQTSFIDSSQSAKEWSEVSWQSSYTRWHMNTWIRRRFSHHVNHSTNFKHLLVDDFIDWFKIILWLSCQARNHIKETTDDRFDVSSSIIRTKRNYENTMSWLRYKPDRCNDEDQPVSSFYEADWHEYHQLKTNVSESKGLKIRNKRQDGFIIFKVAAVCVQKVLPIR